MSFKKLILSNGILLLLFALSGCTKDDNSTNNQSSANPFLVKEYTIFKGNTLSELEISEKVDFKYNSQGQVTSLTRYLYQSGTLMSSLEKDYAYNGKIILENDYINSKGTKTHVMKSFLTTNNLNHVVYDSSIEVTNPSSRWVRLYIYDNNSKLKYSYIDDTMRGSVFEWNGNNLTHEYLINGLMGRFLIMTHTYGNKKNTINTGNFWNDGEKSENLPEKSVEPNYEYNYTYKIESDGFVSEKITAVSSPGGTPYRYELIVYTR